ncbi:hypothetical protein [Rouxiella badensis]|uniref:hypothetical protein n=1 Tax=Rouxiella badensis TaxID=1646377 RepID=UPI00301BAD68
MVKLYRSSRDLHQHAALTSSLADIAVYFQDQASDKHSGLYMTDLLAVIAERTEQLWELLGEAEATGRGGEHA